MNRKTRYWVRRVLMLLMVGAVAFAIYKTMSGGEKQTVEEEMEAPDFQLQTLEGKELKLSALRGQTVLLNFWASWCEPCRDEMPAIEKVYEKHKEKGLVVVGINIAESKLTVKGFVRQLDLSFPIVLDKERKVVDQYQIGPIPTSIFIDKEGRVVRNVKGQMDENQLETYVLEALSR
ncbi:thiol-disulfide oxidoreductase ResA [Kroppenstedtia guangzhouensis]|jgi:peroxiredoxin|uniref:Thiol-disulfide oxidoreductase ResA n=1 Tax=Kroppenstedtia guangzhouensis TaxID=1274356 RepID=A0ABQ1FW60_9BACL|nr:thiol-disulfide oxidoreductase ResA [Kroppenstedtia guangzhouensis]GGA32424.1 thiol-disulfide oxidoreductase ResA [Kroppenstedtia guangzhouensis]